MRSSRAALITLLGLYLAFSQDHCGCCLNSVWTPPAPSISHLQAISDKKNLIVRWMVNHSDLVVDFYEIQVSRSEFHTIIYSRNVSVASAESGNYTLTWSSDVPLECTDHSVRIRAFYSQSGPSPWSSWTTKKGIEAGNKTEVFPPKRVLRNGTNITLCCVPQRGVNITSMAIYGETYPVMSIGARVKAITVPNVTFPTTSIKVLSLKCNVAEGKNRTIWYPISFPPQKPRNLSCVTSDMTTVTCSWDPGTQRHLRDRNTQTYTLHIENSAVAAVSCEKSSCHFLAVPQLEEYDIRLVVRNQLGEETERYSFNISDRVFPVVEWATVSPGVTDTTLSWMVLGKLAHIMRIMCQVSCQTGSSLCQVKLDHLLPNTNYSARVRCSVNGRLWGDSTKNFKTYPLVTLDVWRTIQELVYPHSRQVTLLWIPRVPDSETTDNIKSYVVEWSQKDQNMTERKDSGQTRAQMSIGPERCDFTVTAVLGSGSSVRVHITIPQMNHAGILPVEKRLKDGTTSLSWAKWDNVTCGYTVEWCIQGHVLPCTLRWMKVPEGNNTFILPALGDFEAGYRHAFNIYGCTENGDHLLEIQSGYSQQLQSVTSPSLVEPVQTTSSSVTLQWLYAQDDPAHPAFITGYLVTVQEAGNVFNVSVADPHRKSVVIEGLQQNQEYVFSVCALTEAGPGRSSNITIRTRPDYSSHLAKILTPILLLLGCAILLWPQRKMLQSGLKNIFAYPAGMNIKTLELESFLHETHKRIQRSQTVEECVSCDIEILNVRPTGNEMRTDSEPPNAPSSCPSRSSPSSWGPSGVSLQADYFPQSDLQQITCLTNKSYFHTLEGE